MGACLSHLYRRVLRVNKALVVPALLVGAPRHPTSVGGEHVHERDDPLDLVGLGLGEVCDELARGVAFEHVCSRPLPVKAAAQR